MGLAMLGWSCVEESPTRRIIGYAYLGGAALFTLLYALLARVGPFADRRADEGALPAAGSPRSREGMALLIVILLMALLSGTLLHGLVLTHQRLRAAEWRRESVLLHAAAQDAALAALRAGAAGRPLPLAAPAESRTPAGILTRTRLRPIDRSALPSLLHRPDAPVFGDCYELTAEASRASRSRRVSSLVCRVPAGDMRVLAWIEPL